MQAIVNLGSFYGLFLTTCLVKNLYKAAGGYLVKLRKQPY